MTNDGLAQIFQCLLFRADGQDDHERRQRRCTIRGIDLLMSKGIFGLTHGAFRCSFTAILSFFINIFVNYM